MTDEEKLAEEYRKELKERLLRNDDYERLEMFDENVEEAYLAGRKSNFEVIAELEKENEELKKELKISRRCWQDQKNISLDANCSLYKAKDLIRNLLRVTYGEGWNYSLDWKVKAEQFLKESDE